MERFTYSKLAVVATTMAALALPGCRVSIDSYLTDASGVQCDGRRTITDLRVGGVALFVVHGIDRGEEATVEVSRADTTVSVAVDDKPAGLPRPYVADGAELHVNAADGTWLIDVREDTVVIQGSC